MTVDPLSGHNHPLLSPCPTCDAIGKELLERIAELEAAVRTAANACLSETARAEKAEAEVERLKAVFDWHRQFCPGSGGRESDDVASQASAEAPDRRLSEGSTPSAAANPAAPCECGECRRARAVVKAAARKERA